MVSRILLRRVVAVAAALATAVLAVLVPAAGTAASQFDRAALVRELKAAIADEERALQLLAKSPPRTGTAALALDRSRMRLREILEDRSLPGAVVGAVADAAGFDSTAMESLRNPGSVNVTRGQKRIEHALRLKARAIGALPTPASTGSQCADGRDNDGDRTVDARYDSGCTNAKDGSEGSPLTCSLGYAARDGLSVVQGTCSGPFFKIEISAPPGAKFDTKRAPVVVQDRVCWYASEPRLDCVMGDGVANPRHVVNVRWGYKGVLAAKRLTVTIIDFSGRRRMWVLSQKPAPPPAEPPYNLGPNPVAAVGTFSNGRGGCPVATSFTQGSEWFAPGTGTLTITDAMGRKLSGPIKRDGSFDVRGAGQSFSESYVGKITGNTATGTYTYTASGCTETYDFSAALRR